MTTAADHLAGPGRRISALRMSQPWDSRGGRGGGRHSGSRPAVGLSAIRQMKGMDMGVAWVRALLRGLEHRADGDAGRARGMMSVTWMVAIAVLVIGHKLVPAKGADRRPPVTVAMIALWTADSCRAFVVPWLTPPVSMRDAPSVARPTNLF